MEWGPEESSLILVSAPGAVGKTTLAKEIAHRTGAIYLDLSQSEPVGGNTLAGGLVRSRLYDRWTAQTTAVLIDGLDEARLRVTQEAFDAFLRDVSELSGGRKLPTVLFGRTGSVQDAWFTLADHGIEAPVLEIGYFGPEAALNFATAKLRREQPECIHPQVAHEAIKLLLEGIRNQTESDGDRFAGYAPVLQAVAERVGSESNLGALVAQIQGGAQPVTLHSVVTAILERERLKLAPIQFEDTNIAEKLYLPNEQLGHLVARVYGERPPDPPQMRPADAQAYENVLTTWVADHPFLNGNDRPSSAVFDAVIATWALRGSSSENTRNAAVEREIGRGAAANPFLSEIYLNEVKECESRVMLAEHVGIIYSSLRARLSLGDSASLSIEFREGPNGIEPEEEHVEITRGRRGNETPAILEFRMSGNGVVRLGTHIEDVEISGSGAYVDVGPGSEAVFVAPVSIQCDLLSVESTKVIVEPSPADSGMSVFLEAKDFVAPGLTSAPVVRGNAALAVVWPEARRYPWTNFSIEPVVMEDPRIDEALWRLRKFVIAFRSHGRGRLARFRGKIEHERMTKGSGRSVLELLVSEEILRLDNSMYFLDPDRLAATTGASYHDCVQRRFGSAAMEFVRRAL